MSNDSITILFPVGRLVQGSLYEMQDKDMDGNPLVVKSGPNKGQPTKRGYFAVAYKKGEAHWASTPWGQAIWNYGHGAWPNGQAQQLDFAWKVEDGDDTRPKKKTQRRNIDTEGFAGHWIVKFSSGFVPKVYNADGSAQLLEPNYVKPGSFVEVQGNVATNGNATNPGVYVNYGMVAFAGFGPEITFGPDAASVGFGKGALPPGASSVPPASFAPPAVPGVTPAPPAAYLPPGAAAPPPPRPPQTAVQPSASFIPAPVGNIPPPPAAVPAPPPVRQMTAAANGVTFEQMVTAGWTEAALKAHGYMV